MISITSQYLPLHIAYQLLAISSWYLTQQGYKLSTVALIASVYKNPLYLSLVSKADETPLSAMEPVLPMPVVTPIVKTETESESIPATPEGITALPAIFSDDDEDDVPLGKCNLGLTLLCIFVVVVK